MTRSRVRLTIRIPPLSGDPSVLLIWPAIEVYSRDSAPDEYESVFYSCQWSLLCMLRFIHLRDALCSHEKSLLHLGALANRTHWGTLWHALFTGYHLCSCRETRLPCYFGLLSLHEQVNKEQSCLFVTISRSDFPPWRPRDGGDNGEFYMKPFVRCGRHLIPSQSTPNRPQSHFELNPNWSSILCHSIFIPPIVKSHLILKSLCSVPKSH